MYRERAPWPALATAVEAVWVREPVTGPAGGGELIRVLPDGCTDLIWADGELWVAGPDRRAQVSRTRPGTEFAAVRFRPGAGPRLFGVPAHELCDQRLSLAALWPGRRVRQLADRVTAAADRTAALQELVAAHSDRVGAAEPAVRLIVAQQRAGQPVAATAAALGVSERQLHRRCLAAFGYGPKSLARILRFQQALALARGGAPLAEVAVRTGYADQPHLAREVRRLAGVSLGSLTGRVPAGPARPGPGGVVMS